MMWTYIHYYYYYYYSIINTHEKARINNFRRGKAVEVSTDKNKVAVNSDTE